MFNNQIIFISGGTGSWGQELVKQLLNKYENIKEIRIYSRGEHRQVEMKRQFGFNPKIRFIIGDIRDKSILSYAMKGADIVFHLAALKHVPVCEENTWEAVLTNINGTQNVIESAIFNGVKKVVDVSTDKAVDPFNLYGVTKACGEKLMINANYNYSPSGAKSETAFICIRGGNVLGTNGSIIPLFKKQLLESNEVTVTDPTMTRFLMSAPEAISLIFIAVEKSIGGELFVMKMPAATVAAVSKVMIKLFGNSDSKVKIIGPRPGEKKHEVLVSKNEAQFARIFSDSHYVIFPQIYDEELLRTYDEAQSFDFVEFTSENARLLNDDELEAMLVNEAWLMD
jgi:FlaA1/EpsC-like NDP-sugar epimerase